MLPQRMPVRTLAEALRQESDGTIRIIGISPGFVDTAFAESIKNDQMHTAILKSKDEITISLDAFADVVIYAIMQPKEVEIGFERPQSFSKLFKRKTQMTPLVFRASFLFRASFH